MEGAVAGLAAGLLVAWLAATRRHVRRRQASAEWDGSADRPDLWTSAARCPACGARGGLMTLDGDEAVFECLRCGDRHSRSQRG